MATQAIPQGGLFGPSLDEYTQAQTQRDDQAAVNFAGMDDNQRNSYLMYKAGGMLMKPIMGALGYENTAESRIKKVQDISSKYDTTTADGLMQTAKAFNDAGMSREAQIAMNKAREMQAAETERKLKEAQATKALREPTFRGYEIENLLGKLDEYEPESPEYKAVEARIKFLTTLKVIGGGSKGGGSAQITRMFDPQTNATYLVRTSKTPGEASEVVSIDGVKAPPDVVARLVEAANSADLKSKITQASAGGAAVGKLSGEAQMALPKIESDIATVKELGTRLFNHPGFKELVGAGTPGLRLLQGSSVPGAKAFVDQINGISYLMARQELKNQGQVTENEANAAQAAFSRMNIATSERDFMEAYNDFVKRVENVRELLRKQSSMTYGQNRNNSGYAGGNKGAADAGRLEILMQELKNPALTQADKDALNREIARTKGTAPQSREAQFKVLR